MRFRFILLVVAILLVAGFAALNWSEVIRPAPLLFGAFVMDAPLGAILLGLLAVAVLVFAISAASIRTESLMESRQHFKKLEEQRALADRAEASRFTDLRQHLDTHLRELKQRDTMAAGEFEKSVVQGQRELHLQMEQINRTLAARLTEIEHRLDARLDRLQAPGVAPARDPVRTDTVHPAAVRPLDPPAARDPLRREPTLHEPPLREPSLHGSGHPVASERVHQQRLAEERQRQESAQRDDKAGTSGWRKWF